MIPGFHWLHGAWLFFLIVPLVVFYFLKLKRPRLEVPSLVLWRQVMNDSRVNSPFQRFKRNILLLVQLIALCLLVLGCMLPFVRRRTGRAGRLPVLIDCSASMGALDAAGGKSRLDVAKENVARLIDDLQPGDELCLVSFGDTASRLTGFTDNKTILHEALEAIGAQDVPSRLDGALGFAEALARAAPIDEVLLLSDGNVPDTIDFDLPFRLDYQRLPRAGANFGITMFEAQSTSDGRWLVVCRVEASEGATSAATLKFFSRLGVTGETTALGERTVTVAGDAAQRVAFRVDGGAAVSLRAVLVPDGFDALASDNVAHLHLPVVRALRVHVPTSLAACRHALSAQPRTDVFPKGPAETGEGVAIPDETSTAAGAGTLAYDLVVASDESDDDLVARTIMFVGVIPTELKELIEVEQGGTEVVDWRRDSPLLRHVSLKDLVISGRAAARGGALDRDFEELGYEVLVHGRHGPLLLEKRRGQTVRYYFTFDFDTSTLPYRVGFPILFANLAEEAAREAGLSEARGARTGVLEATALTPGGRYAVTGPDGTRRSLTADASGVLRGIPAPLVGEYVISTTLSETVRMGASLLCASETSLAGVDEIQFTEVPVKASAMPLETDKPLWLILGFIAFWVMMAEWWLFHRRRRLRGGG
jgi:hypothetical protein